MRSVDSKFYKNKKWINCRNSYYDLRNGLCERCLQKGDYVKGEIVHHKVHLTEANYTNPDIAYGIDNLELLCKDCHNNEHFGRGDGKTVKLDELGNIIW